MRFSILLIFILTLVALLMGNVYAREHRQYLYSLCNSSKFHCIKVKKGDTWQKLWTDPEQRDIVQRLNRTDMHLRSGQTLLVPNHISTMSIWDISPFDRKIDNHYGKKLIVVDQNKLAWGAYDVNGELQWWGPISSGKDYCKDVGRSCKTITGMFYVFNRDDLKCESSAFPVGEGGAKMPYCMFFYRGYALHGSDEVPGYRDSHGCVRLFTRDAKWLNHHFITLPSAENSFTPTTAVIIQDVES